MVFLHSSYGGVGTRTGQCVSTRPTAKMPSALSRQTLTASLTTFAASASKLLTRSQDASALSESLPCGHGPGVGHTLLELRGEGHCAFPQDQLWKKASELLEIEEDIVRAATEHEIAEGHLVRDKIGDEPWIYLAALYHAEVTLAARVRELQAGTHPLPSINVEKALVWVEGCVRLRLAQAQRDAIASAATSKVLIVTGGPGVGKTTIVDSILRIFSAKGLECLLCAPTGRAAKRLSETTGREAKTIHRMLEYDPANHGFKRNADNPLEG